MSKASSPQFAFFVGIDWAHERHAVVVIDRTGAVSRQTLEQSTEAIDAWCSELLARADGQPIAIILEQSRGALIHALMFRDQLTLFPVNPKQFASYRASFQTTKAKSDPTDALLLARMLFERHRQMKAWSPDDENTRLIGMLCQQRRKWVDRQTKRAQQLLELLKGYFPALLQLAPSKVHTCALLLQILRRHADPREVRRLHPKTLQRLFIRFSRMNEQQRNQAIDQLRQAPLHCKDPALNTASALEATALAQELLNCKSVIGKLDNEIDQAMRKSQDATLFTQIKGAGAALAPRLLAAFGSDRERFQSAEEVASYCGIAPVTKQSGKSRSVVRRIACSKFLLQTFHEFASAAAKWCPWSKAFYQQQKQSGMKRNAILRKLAYKWIRILFRVWKDRTPYRQDAYIQSLRIKNPSLIPYLDQVATSA